MSFKRAFNGRRCRKLCGEESVYKECGSFAGPFYYSRADLKELGENILAFILTCLSCAPVYIRTYIENCVNASRLKLPSQGSSGWIVRRDAFSL